MERSFIVKTTGFEGPLELLLSLIEKHRLHISDVSLATVADDFLAFVASHKEFPLAEAAHFLLVASTLLLIKSKSLLPSLSLTSDEAGDIADLERRLRLYQRIKGLSPHIFSSWDERPLFSREPSKNEQVIFVPTASVVPSALLGAVKAVLQAIPQAAKLGAEAVVEKVISIEEMIERLGKRVSEALKLSFKEFAGIGKAKRIDVIVSFLAMLELVKQGAVSVRQEAHFDDIAIETGSIKTPRY